jgi:hypothetical protein
MRQVHHLRNHAAADDPHSQWQCHVVLSAPAEVRARCGRRHSTMCPEPLLQ